MIVGTEWEVFFVSSSLVDMQSDVYLMAAPPFPSPQKAGRVGMCRRAGQSVSFKRPAARISPLPVLSARHERHTFIIII